MRLTSRDQTDAQRPTGWKNALKNSNVAHGGIRQSEIIVTFCH